MGYLIRVPIDDDLTGGHLPAEATATWKPGDGRLAGRSRAASDAHR